MTALEILQNGWTQGAMARTADGKPCEALSYGAVVFSITGALIRAYAGTGNFAEMYHKFYAANECLNLKNGKFLIDYNDAPTTTKEDAIESLKRAGV